MKHAAAKNKCDKLFSELIRSIGLCERCGKSGNVVQLQTAHIYSRRYLNLRHDPLNALCLCASCHHWAHDNPILFTKFVESKRTPKQLTYLQDKRNSLTKVDFTDKTTELKILLDNAIKRV